MAPLPLVESPKFHEYDTIDWVESGWKDPEALNATVPPAVPSVAGSTEQTALGGNSKSDGDNMMIAHDVD